MATLWTPWRIKYVRKFKKRGCVFCRCIKSKYDKKNLILFRGKFAFIILNLYPYNNGHLMVAPYSHKPKLRNLKPEELEEMIKLLKYSQSLLDKVLQPTGYNIGINEGRVSGAGIVNHVHMHVVPRWQGDTNFMPVVSQTKIIPQALSELYQKLKKAM